MRYILKLLLLFPSNTIHPIDFIRIGISTDSLHSDAQQIGSFRMQIQNWMTFLCTVLHFCFLQYFQNRKKKQKNNGSTQNIKTRNNGKQIHTLVAVNLTNINDRLCQEFKR